jgi:hypothetical protein
MFIKGTAGECRATDAELTLARYSIHQIQGLLQYEKKQRRPLMEDARLQLVQKLGGPKAEQVPPPDRLRLIRSLQLQGIELPRFWEPLGLPTTQSLAYNKRLGIAKGQWHVDKRRYEQANPGEQLGFLLVAYIVFEAGECAREACGNCETANQCWAVVDSKVPLKCARCILGHLKECKAGLGHLF